MYAPLYECVEEIEPGMSVYMNDEYAGYVSYISDDENPLKVCIITGNLADGKYTLDILVKNVNLMNFIFN